MQREEVINTRDFGLSQHRYRLFDATVSPNRNTEESLTDPKFWANVAGQMEMGSEIRVLAEDFSFRAILIVTFAQGTVVRLKLVDFTQLEKVEVEVPNADYEIKLRGMRRWSIVKKETGEIVQEDIATKGEAMKALESFLRALAA